MEKFAPVTHCEVDDLGTCGTSFEVIIVSVSLKKIEKKIVKITKKIMSKKWFQSIFEGKKTLEKHRIVNEALKDEIALLHAFSQKSFTPAQWEKKQAQA